VHAQKKDTILTDTECEYSFFRIDAKNKLPRQILYHPEFSSEFIDIDAEINAA
jgi:hypothetical protein